MNKYKDSIKTVAVLAIIALVSGLLLSFVNSKTTVDEAKAAREKIESVYTASAVKDNIELNTYTNLDNSEILFAFTMEDGSYAIISHSKRAYSAYGLDVLVFIKDNKIIEVFPYYSEETPGKGDLVLNNVYLTRYIGLDVAAFSATEINMEKDSGSVKNIDGATGATVTSNATSTAINGAIYLYRQIKGIA